jgi:hypothetical protein
MRQRPIFREVSVGTFAMCFVEDVSLVPEHYLSFLNVLDVYDAGWKERSVGRCGTVWVVLVTIIQPGFDYPDGSFRPYFCSFKLACC